MLELLNFTKQSKVKASNTLMLLRFDNGAVADVVNPERTFEIFGTNVSFRNNIKKFGTHSLYVGHSSRLQTPDSPELNLGVNDFTIETFVYHAAIYVNTCIFAKSASNLRSSLLTYSSSGNKLGITSDSGIIAPTDMGIVPVGTWVHWTLMRKNSKWYLFKNGVLAINAATNAGTFGTNPSPFTIGGFSYSPTSASLCDAYFDEFRVSKIARYDVKGFTPPVMRFIVD